MVTELMTPAQVADALHLSRQTIYNWISARKLPAVHLGNKVRIPASAVEALISTNMQEASYGKPSDGNDSADSDRQDQGAAG